MALFDAHNHVHLTAERGDGAERALDELHRHDIYSAVASTCENDWNTLTELQRRFPDRLQVGLGIHPWWANSTRPGWAERLESILLAHPNAFVGEAGLDGYRSLRPQGIALETQRQTLIPQLQLAQKHQRPVVLHCVKAWEQLSGYLKATKVERFALHRYKGTPTQAQELFQMGGYVSIHLDSIWNQETKQGIRKAPLQRILIETDYDGPRPESLPFVAELNLVLKELSGLLGKDPEYLAELTTANALEFYGIDANTFARSFGAPEVAVRT